MSHIEDCLGVLLGELMENWKLAASLHTSKVIKQLASLELGKVIMWRLKMHCARSCPRGRLHSHCECSRVRVDVACKKATILPIRVKQRIEMH